MTLYESSYKALWLVRYVLYWWRKQTRQEVTSQLTRWAREGDQCKRRQTKEVWDLQSVELTHPDLTSLSSDIRTCLDSSESDGCCWSGRRRVRNVAVNEALVSDYAALTCLRKIRWRRLRLDCSGAWDQSRSGERVPSGPKMFSSAKHPVSMSWRTEDFSRPEPEIWPRSRDLFRSCY